VSLVSDNLEHLAGLDDYRRAQALFRCLSALLATFPAPAAGGPPLARSLRCCFDPQQKFLCRDEDEGSKECAWDSAHCAETLAISVESNDQCEQFNHADCYHQHCECYRIVIEPMPPFVYT
jgi:hypothetical protein